MAPKVTLVTPTGNRPDSFAICEKMMASQTFQDFEWVVVDDGETPIKTTMHQRHIPGPVRWQEGYNTQRFNLNAAIPYIRGEYVFMIEDDDYYHPRYLETYLHLLEAFDMVGEGNAKYYNIKNKAYMEQKNYTHTSLASVAFNIGVLPTFLRALHSGDKFFDITFWELAQKEQIRNLIFCNKNLSVGIKGMPGRVGIGIGHSPKAYNSDPFGTVLKRWVGEEMYSVYSKLYKGD